MPVLFRLSTYSALFCVLILSLAGCDDSSSGNASTDVSTAERPADSQISLTASRGVDTSQIVQAAPQDWLSHGRDYSEQRHSPLSSVTLENVDQLGLAWSFDLGDSRGIEATPLVHDGVLYMTATWNVVYALDARTGKQKWRFDPQVDKSRAAYLCCDAVNRGAALWGDKVYTGTIDGRLIAINRETGKEVWSTLTIDLSQPYTITGAPRIIDGKVIIGNGGADFGVRGYVSAYDAETGDLVWRFYTVPGDPANGHESKALEHAASTWNGEWWKAGGGGTVWDAMAYDADEQLLYIGVGNGSPWNQAIRSPGGGDNLFLSSIVALNVETGEYVWHYQTTPGETWDYTATQHMILAELEINGELRKVIMQAPKNGFFYVIDRLTGEFISANNFATVNWATHIDPDSGRPVEIPEARWPSSGIYQQMPSPFGAHNWHPMSYSPKTGLVYIPAQEIPFAYGADQDYQYELPSWNTGVDMALGSLPSDAATLKAVKAMIKGKLLAWNPVTQQAEWEVDLGGPWNGGVLSTAGGLVFQGAANGYFSAYDAENGKRLWSYFGQSGIVAAPITYELDGEQYVAVATGWGGVLPLSHGGLFGATQKPVGRVLSFKLNGDQRLPDLEPAIPIPFVQVKIDVEPDDIEKGKLAYGRNCLACHGDAVIASGQIPDLRRSAYVTSADAFYVVVSGALAERGMPNFAELIDAEQAERIRAYIASAALKAAGAE